MTAKTAEELLTEVSDWWTTGIIDIHPGRMAVTCGLPVNGAMASAINVLDDIQGEAHERAHIPSVGEVPGGPRRRARVRPVRPHQHRRARGDGEEPGQIRQRSPRADRRPHGRWLCAGEKADRGRALA